MPVTEKHLGGLNEPQKRAVLHINGPLLIVAGAGAGKTRTITHRIAHLIRSGVPAHSILAVTFTNKAAGEMQSRVAKLLGKTGMPLISTFHSLGVRLLREFSEQGGVARGFSIWDRDDSTRAIKKALEKLGMSEKPGTILAAISRAKGEGMVHHEYSERARTIRERAVAQVWNIYDSFLKEQAAVDFDDLLLLTLLMLRGSPEILKLLQNRWSHITIDEYQDTNKSQYEIARLLAGERKNICVVGDLDQCIYTWRQARIENLLEFEKEFPGTKVVTLEQNYRSTGTILAAANAIIEKNTRRSKKRLFTSSGTGEPIGFYGAQNEIDEAWFIAATAQRLMEKGIAPKEMAVLYRENFQSRAIEEAMLGAGLPYRVLGTRFFERKEVKDVLSYVRAALNPKSKIDLSRSAASPPRGIGRVTLEKIFSGDEAGFSLKAREKVTAFKALLNAIRKAIETLPASEAVKFVIEVSGTEKHYKADKENGHEVLENIRELVNLSTKYDFEKPPVGIERLLEEAALMSEQDELNNINSEGISLLTAHASKGLEFDAVFIAGMEQGLFPSQRGFAESATDSERDPEEERRLFYVAMTRARKRLFLSYAAQRMKYGSREYTLPSEFLEDIDRRLIEHVSPEKPVKEQIIY